MNNFLSNYDYLIVGQGIAGTMLAHFLLKRGKSILVADKFNASSASNVAAGLCNPVTGKRLVKTWKANEIFPFAESTYGEIEQMLDKKFWFRKNIVKILSGKDEMEQYNNRVGSGEFSGLIIPLVQKEYKGVKLQEGFEISGSGYLEMSLLIAEYKKKLHQEGIFVEGLVSFDDLTFEHRSISWKGQRYGKVIFCEGYKAEANPLFQWLPFVLAKGEVLIIESGDLQMDKILSRDIFILPLGNKLYKVGSTYQWDNLNENPTEVGKSRLVKKLEQLIDCRYTIVSQLAGIRPTVKDRKPFIGLHPKYPQIGIFNGLGAKGASLAPYFASHFVDFLEDGKALDGEVDIARFGKGFLIP